MAKFSRHRTSIINSGGYGGMPELTVYDNSGLPSYTKLTPEIISDIEKANSTLRKTLPYYRIQDERLSALLSSNNLNTRKRYELNRKKERLDNARSQSQRILRYRTQMARGYFGVPSGFSGSASTRDITGSQAESTHWGTQHLESGIPYGRRIDPKRRDMTWEEIARLEYQEDVDFNASSVTKRKVRKPIEGTSVGIGPKLEKELDLTEFHTSRNMLKWKNRQRRTRLRWYSRIHFENFDDRFLLDMGYARKGRNLHRIERLGDIEQRSIESRIRQGESLVQDTLHGNGIISLNELFYPGASQLDIRESSHGSLRGNVRIGKRAKNKEMLRDAVEWEIANKDIVTRTHPNKYYGSEYNWQIGSSSIHIHHMMPDQQVLYAEKVLGQKNYLVTSHGKTVVPGQKSIVGRYLHNYEKDYSDLREEFSGMNPKTRFLHARKLYARIKDVLPEENREGIEKLFQEVGGPQAMDPGRYRYDRNFNSRKAEKLNTKFWDLINASRLENVNLKGFRENIEFLNNLPIGSRVRLDGGETATVAAIENAEHIAIKLKNRKVISLRDMIFRDEENLRKMMFPVKLIRQPYNVGGELDPTRTIVSTLSGNYIGTINPEDSKELYRNITRGVLPEENIFGRIIPNKAKTRFSLELLRDVNGAISYSGFRIPSGGAEGALEESLVKKIFNKQIDISESPGGWRETLEKKYGDTRTASIGRDTIKTPTGRSIPVYNVPKKKILNRNILMTSALVAGALIAYKATATKNSPIRQEDVQNNLYGSSDLPNITLPTERVYTPKTRISQNNSGYNVDLSVEAHDEGGSMDDRQLAAMLSAVSNRALGLNTSMSLNVMDGSQRMDRESTRVKINSYLD